MTQQQQQPPPDPAGQPIPPPPPVKGMSGKKKAAIVIGVLLLVLIAVGVAQRGQTPPAGTIPPNYQAEYGGSAQVYADIAASSDCALLQESFDRAAGNNERAAPGTAEHRWTLGYMEAADDRMRAVGCFD